MKIPDDVVFFANAQMEACQHKQIEIETDFFSSCWSFIKNLEFQIVGVVAGQLGPGGRVGRFHNRCRSWRDPRLFGKFGKHDGPSISEGIGQVRISSSVYFASLDLFLRGAVRWLAAHFSVDTRENHPSRSPVIRVDSLYPYRRFEMKFGILGIAAFAMLSAPSFATNKIPSSCADASGDYTNMTDPARPQVKIAQDGCDRLTITDTAGIPWPIEFDGRSMPLPPAANQAFPLLSNTFYTGRWENLNTILLTGVTDAVFSPPGGIRISMEIAYQAEAYILPGPKGQKPVIQVVTRNVEIVSADANHIVNGQTLGFLQGTNWVLDIVKHVLDVRLE